MKLGSVWRTSLPVWNRVGVKCEDKFNHWRSYVATWSPLASTFNARPASKLFKLKRNEAGLFGINELKDPSGFYLLKDAAIEDTDRLVAEACSSKRTRKMVVVFDELSDTLCKVADMAEFIRNAHPDPQFASAAEDATVSINALVERLNTNQELYNALKVVVEKGDVVPTDDVDEHVAKLFLFDFEQSAIHLDHQRRKRVVQLNDAILQMGALFMKSSSNARLLPKDGLPQNITTLFPSQGDNLVFTNLHSDSPIEAVRQVAYKVFMLPDALQEKRLKDMLIARQELAHLCGFSTFAHRVLSGSLAETPESVGAFLDNLSSHLKPLAQLEFDAMLNLKLRHSSNSNALHMWDTPYFSAMLRNEMIDIEASDYANYFSLGVCVEGISQLLHRLYGVSLQVNEVRNGEVWSNDIYKLSVVHDVEGTLGYIYLDLFERPGKLNQDCHFTIRGGRQLSNGHYQLPVVVLLFSFPSPSNSSPCLLSLGMVENLFHEMGHAMHSMLGRTKYQHVTGTRCSTDFAEVPSILMEYFASDSRVLSEFSRDYKTGEKMPQEKLNKLCELRSSLNACDLQLQVFYSALDQSYHGELNSLGLTKDSNLTTTDILTGVQKKYYNIPHVPHTAWQLRFNHLVGYGAKYYSYLLSKSVASWIWQENFINDPFSREAGDRYRREVLSHGGGKPPKKILQDYLKKELTPEKLVEFLITEVEKKSRFAANVNR